MFQQTINGLFTGFLVLFLRAVKLKFCFVNGTNLRISFFFYHFSLVFKNIVLLLLKVSGKKWSSSETPSADTSETPKFSSETPIFSPETPKRSGLRPLCSHQRPQYLHQRPQYSHRRPQYFHIRPQYFHIRPQYFHIRTQYFHIRAQYFYLRPQYSHMRPQYFIYDTTIFS